MVFRRNVAVFFLRLILLIRYQIDEVFEQGVGDLTCKLPTLLVLNKKDLIKPGEIAKKIEVHICDFCFRIVM